MCKYIKSIAAFLLAGALIASAGCSDKDKNKKSSSSSKESSSSSSVKEKDEKTTAAASSEESTESTIPTEPVTVVQAENGYDSAVTAVRNYYNAYLTNDYEAVYNMFSEDEIKAYQKYVKDGGMIGEEDPEKTFGKGNIIKAIKASMANIRSFMAENGGKPAEQWGVSLKDEDLSALSAEEVNIFNNKLGTDFTSGFDCNFVYYVDGDENHSFLGNDCAVLEKNGRWYVSFSTVLSSELITFLDIY